MRFFTRKMVSIYQPKLCHLFYTFLLLQKMNYDELPAIVEYINTKKRKSYIGSIFKFTYHMEMFKLILMKMNKI